MSISLSRTTSRTIVNAIHAHIANEGMREAVASIQDEDPFGTEEPTRVMSSELLDHLRAASVVA